MDMSSDLHRTNINLYTSDVDYLRKHYGFGWTEVVREALHNWVLMQKAVHSGGHQSLVFNESANIPQKTWDNAKSNLSRRYIDNTEVPDDD